MKLSKEAIIILSVLLGVFSMLNWNCKTPLNYLLPNTPLWKNNTISIQPTFQDTLKVVSFNIEFSEAIEEAISELKTHKDLANADILLLQEMHEIKILCLYLLRSCLDHFIHSLWYDLQDNTVQCSLWIQKLAILTEKKKYFPGNRRVDSDRNSKFLGRKRRAEVIKGINEEERRKIC